MDSDEYTTGFDLSLLCSLLLSLLVLGLLHDTLVLLLELEDLLLLRCHGLAKLLNKVVHVLDLLVNLGDNLGLALLEEDAIDQAPALTRHLKVLNGVQHKFMLLLFIFDLEDLLDECGGLLLEDAILLSDLLLLYLPAFLHI